MGIGMYSDRSNTGTVYMSCRIKFQPCSDIRVLFAIAFMSERLSFIIGSDEAAKEELAAAKEK